MMAENGIRIKVETNHNKPKKCKTFYNPVMKICREICLSCLQAYCDTNAKTQPAKCLEAFGATGIGGMQWKKYCKKAVQVTINELDSEAFNNILENCTENGFIIKKGVEKAEDEEKTGDISSTVRGDGDNSQQRTDIAVEDGSGSHCMDIEPVLGDAHVILHSRQFNFIHLDPFGTTVQFLDSAFRNLYHQGVLVLTSTDVATLYDKCPQVTQRNYGATTCKADYMKELGARIVLATAARAAARCNKGIEVLYCVAVEHFIQVAVRVHRGATHADRALTHVRRLLHCQLCEEWALHPESKVLLNDPYSLLPCNCRSLRPGRTAIELGPAWCGNIFNADFVTAMKAAAKRLELSARINQMLTILAEESVCKGDFNAHTAQPRDTDSTCAASEGCASEDRAVIGSPSRDVTGAHKRLSKDEELPIAKKFKAPRQCLADEQPLFYYSLHRRRISHVDLPKIHRMVALLHREGFRASRTTFNPQAVRTDASLEQLKEVLLKYHRQAGQHPETTPEAS